MNDWQRNKLVVVAELVMGQSPDGKSYNSESIGMPFLQGCAEFGKVNPLTTVYSSQIKKIGRNNSILFSVRAQVGKINIADQDYCIGRGLSAITGNKVNQDYLYQYLQLLRDMAGFSSQGSTFDSINFDELSKVEIQSPVSETEQKQIASILNTADEAISKTKKVISKYQRIKIGLMQDLLMKGIDTKGNIRNKNSYKFINKHGIEVPEDWDVVRFGDFIELVHGYQFRNFDFTVHGVGVVKIGEVKPGGVDLTSCSFVAEQRLEEFPKQQIRNGDVLMALTGATLGKACLVRNVSVPLLQNYRVGRFEPRFDDFDKKYIYFCLKSDLILNQIFNKVNSGAQGNIGKTDFENVWIRKPNIEEQIKIAERLFLLDETIESEANYLTKLHSTKTGLMQDLLSGKIRVK